MRTFIECVPCAVRQAYEALMVATDDTDLREELLRDALRRIAEVRFDLSPPHLATDIHRMIRERTGMPDPYHDQKARHNQAALRLLPAMREIVRKAEDPFATAIRLAISGNAIDLGAPGCVQEHELENMIDEAMSNPIFGASPDQMLQACNQADSILILGDNAGEIVFDQLLLEFVPSEKVTYTVKGSPVINDATMDDARATGMCDLAQVIDNGSDAPGTVLEWCSREFRERFRKAGLVIAKGQGNYETLSGMTGPEHPRIFFLLKAKCPVVAGGIGCDVGDFVICDSREA